MLKNFFKQKLNLALVFIILLAFFLRFYKLGEVPLGFYQDESAIGFNAYSILQTGKDEYGTKFPLYFKSFGDYKLPVYIYSTILPIKFFGLSEFAIRFNSALFGFLTVVMVYFLVGRLSGDKKLAVISTFLLAINPWHLHYNRATFEVSMVLFFYVSGFYLLVLSFSHRIKAAFFLGTLLFVASIYTYNLTRLLSPLLYLLILYNYLPQLKKTPKSEAFATIVLSIILLLPLASTFFTKGGFASAKGTLIFSSAAVQASLLEFRSYLIVLPNLFTKIFFNSLVLTVWQYVKNVISYLSVNFFFISGSTHGNHGIGNAGQFYIFELPLIGYGIYKIFKDKLSWGYQLIKWAIVIVLIASLTREAPHATRSFFLVFPLTVFSALGMFYLHKIFFATFNKKRLLIASILFIFSIYSILYYFVSYYIYFPKAYAKSWSSSDKDLAVFIKSQEKKYDEIIIDKDANLKYTSLLFFQQYNPLAFQNTVQRTPDDSEGFNEVTSFGKFKYQKINWTDDLKAPNRRLLITSANMPPANIQSLKTFYYPKRPVVIAVKQEILNYPVDDIAYVVYESSVKK